MLVFILSGKIHSPTYGLPRVRLEYRRAYRHVMLAEDEATYDRMRSDPARSIPLRDASQKLSRETLPMPGLISRFTAKTPDDLWAAYYEHPMAFAFSNVKNSDDFVVVLDDVLESWMNIRREVDASAYIHKELLQRVRTLAPKATQERVTKMVNAIDTAPIGANNYEVDVSPRGQSLKVFSTTKKTRTWTRYALTTRRRYVTPRLSVVGIEVVQYVMDPTDMVGVDNVYGEMLSQIVKDEGFADASINAAYQPVPTHGSSHVQLGGRRGRQWSTAGLLRRPRSQGLCESAEKCSEDATSRTVNIVMTSRSSRRS